MPKGGVYVVDSSAFIDAKRRYYAFDLAPKFWTSLIQEAHNGRIESIDKIKGELDLGKDELTKWANEEFLDYFSSSDDDDINLCFSEVMKWVSSQSQYSDAAKAKFANDADGWLIAYAKVKDRIIVTQEVSSPDSVSKVKIPDVCRPLSVSCVDTFEMLRKLGIKWE
jgi:hypothetical protein